MTVEEKTKEGNIELCFLFAEKRRRFDIFNENVSFCQDFYFFKRNKRFSARDTHASCQFFGCYCYRGKKSIDGRIKKAAVCFRM